jgi:hypothetical protein
VAAIYVFIPNHVRRVIGSYSIIRWSRHAPYYPLDATGQPVRRGSFQSDRAGLTRLYDFLHGDYVLRYGGVDFPPWLAPRHFEHCAALLEAAAARFKAQFGSDRFWVVLFPDAPGNEFDPAVIAPYLRDRGIAVLDYSRLFAGVDEPLFYGPHDSHPRARAYALLADAMARDPDFLRPLP